MLFPEDNNFLLTAIAFEMQRSTGILVDRENGTEEQGSFPFEPAEIYRDSATDSSSVITKDLFFLISLT